MSSYRNIRFNFHGTYGGALMARSSAGTCW